MNKIKIILDSAASLPESLIKEKNIDIVYLKVIWPEEGIEGKIKSEDLFKRMRNTLSDTFPKTSQPSVGDFKKAYEEAFKNNEEIICITLSTGISGTYNSAMQAIKFMPKEKQNKIRVIDSFTIDSGEGFIALKACELREKGVESKEIAPQLEEFKKHVYIAGFPGDPKWIEKNGRLSKTGANLIRRLEKIGIRPLLTLKDGKVKVTSLKFKAKDKAESLLNELKGKIKDDKAMVAITHADMLEVAEDLKRKLIKECPNIEVLFIDAANPIIGCHLGPDSIICNYYLKKYDA
ncbi:MAG: DegV family protein [Candidatus Pacebacteria bacterium]|nr:DegV family protein [Candidatus Paceibacterota bacterium]